MNSHSCGYFGGVMTIDPAMFLNTARNRGSQVLLKDTLVSLLA